VKRDNFSEGFYKLIPVARNQVILRLENLADRFDRSNETAYINVDKLARDLYFEINKKHPESLTIEEVTI
jgi:hypothetical protein